MDISKSIRAEIKEGASIYDLYAKYECHLPNLSPRDAVEKYEVKKKLTDEEWDKWEEDALIDFLEMQIEFDPNSIVELKNK